MCFPRGGNKLTFMQNRTLLLYRFNIWAMGICMFFAVFLSVFVFYSKYYVFFFVGSALFGANAVLIKQNYVKLAGYIFLLATHTLMLLFDQGIMSPVRSFSFYIPLLLCNLFIINPRQKLHQFISVSLTVGCIILTSLTYVTPKLSSGLHDSSHVSFVAYFNVILSLILCITIYYLMNQLSLETVEVKEAADDTLRKNQLLLNSINQNIDIGVCRTDALTNRIIYANHAFLNLFGYKNLDDLRQTNPQELYYAASDREEILTEHKTKHGSTSKELLFKRKDGGLFWGLINSSYLINEEGRMVFDGAVRDITSIMKMQQELIDAKEAAEKTSLFKSQFLSSMSHEIRTPMNAVIGACNLLLSEEPKPEQKENLLLIKSAGSNLMRLINNILDFSRIESGKLDFEETPTDFAVVLKEITDTHYIEAKRKNIELRLNIEEDNHVYLLDPMWFTQVLNNLIANAVKFTQKGSVQVNLKVCSETSLTRTLRFEVVDTGIGVSPDKQEHIFKSFSQEMLDTKRKFGGTGLGLAITKNILQRMGSEIKMVSEKGEGSTFYFGVTLKKAVLEQAPQRHTPKTLSIKGLKVLVVEDNQTNQFIIQKFLAKWGVDFNICERGAEVVKMAKAGNFEVVLMDLHMPDLNGFEASKQIRSYHPQIPIIAMTADAFEETRELTAQAGMNDFISKPFDPDDLFNKLANYADNPKEINSTTP